MAVTEEILPNPSVADFYDGQEIFVTGGTGFLGKSLIEKLLYSTKVKRIYLLLRSKKGFPAEKRLRELRKDVVFERVSRCEGDLMDKLVPICGDVRELGLQMSAESVAQLRNVSIVIHGAATVRFDEPLKDSILMNTRGTHEVLVLAQKLPKLKLFAHISTAYCNPHIRCCDETLYPIDLDWRAVIKMAETLELETLETCAKKFIGYHPNSYTFSKQVSEHMVNDFAREHSLPVLIHRPSIGEFCLLSSYSLGFLIYGNISSVSPSLYDPVRGWVDNFNGPVGIMIPIAFGISRILLGRRDCRLNFVPVDFITNSIIVAISQEGVKTQNKDEPIENVPIYNFGMQKSKCVDIDHVIENGMGEVAKYPLENMVWYPSTIITSSLLFYKIFFTVVQLFPAIVLDTILRVFGQKLR